MKIFLGLIATKNGVFFKKTSFLSSTFFKIFFLSKQQKLLRSKKIQKFLTFSCHKNEHKKWIFYEIEKKHSNWIRKNTNLFFIFPDWEKNKKGRKVNESTKLWLVKAAATTATTAAAAAAAATTATIAAKAKKNSKGLFSQKINEKSFVVKYLFRQKKILFYFESPENSNCHLSQEIETNWAFTFSPIFSLLQNILVGNLGIFLKEGLQIQLRYALSILKRKWRNRSAFLLLKYSYL